MEMTLLILIIAAVSLFGFLVWGILRIRRKMRPIARLILIVFAGIFVGAILWFSILLLVVGPEL